ncbi:MAG: glutamate synthase-related protein [Butyricicoccaceae bacterium]
MAVYVCTVCGYRYDEDKEGTPYEQLEACPACKQPKEKLILAEQEQPKPQQAESGLAYDPASARSDPSCRYMEEIHQMAVSGHSVHAAMGTKMPMPGWDDILLLGAQLDPMPLDDDAPVRTTTVIGPNAKRPMILDHPVYISHMSFGALSRETKIALAKGSAAARTAMCSGEGGILPEERDAAYRYIFEYVPNLYSVTDENLRRADAIEIKIGQGTKPGMGGHLPGGKVTAEIAAARGKPIGQDIKSPSRFADIRTKEELRERVAELRARSDGRPIGIKIAAGHIERDLAFCVFAEPDFITIDGRGGATASSPLLLRDATSVPTIYALYRARKYLDEIRSDISLVITGGLRVSSDFAKALAMGADAVAVASGALIAAACQQYRICGTGNCPVGIATQDPELRARLNGDAAAARVANYLNVSLEELKTFARVTGHDCVHDLNVGDLCTINREISEFTNIPHV